MSVLFDKIPTLLHGGDYNPDQWLDRPDILEEDIRLMKLAGINTATLGVFAWATYEPVEGEFHFDWLHQIMDKLYENGIYTVLATPSGARPAWLDLKYPEAMRVSSDGIRIRHGQRHNHCFASPQFREKVRIIDTKLAEEFGSHPGLILWHISNELGGACYCDLCRARFQDYLRRRYDNSIEKLNHEWWTPFWSHQFNDFSQIDPPYDNGEHTIMGLLLDWKRFNSENATDFMNFERDVLKSVAPDVPVTTNFMRMFKTFDYFKMAKELDVISWDGYPDWNNDHQSVADLSLDYAFDHAMMRSLKKDRPFMLMESTPSLVNWHPTNKIKRPGVHRVSSLQAIAAGSDTVQYFQWRKGRGSFEQYHGAVVDHLGSENTRVFREVSEVGSLLKKLSVVTGSMFHSQVAIMLDWDSWWAVEDLLGLSKERVDYIRYVRSYYKELLKLGVNADFVSTEEDLSSYKVVFLPMLYAVPEALAERISAFVENGGTVVGSFLTAYVNENTLCYLGGFPGAGLRKVFGLYAEEIDTLYPSETNQAVFSDSSTFEIRDFCEVLVPEEAETVARYGKDYYQGQPVITRNSYGKGTAYYIGANVNSDCLLACFADVLKTVGIDAVKLPEGIQYYERFSESGVRYVFYVNASDTEQTIDLEGDFLELISGREIKDSVTVPALNLVVLEERKK